MARLLSALLVVALCIGAAQAQHIAAELTKGGFTSALALGKCAGIDKAIANSAAKVTVLAPTNAAIDAFAKEMGMSVADIQKNEALCDAIVQYHIIPTVANSTAIPATKTLVARTLRAGSMLRFSKSGAKVTVTDAQGNKATVTKGDVVAGGSVIHGVDRVLLSRAVFTSPAKALAFHSKRFSTLIGALKKANLTSTIESAGFAGTILAPSDRAFSKVPGALALATGTLKNVLLYHVMPAPARAIPNDFASGKSYATLLKGQTVKYTLTTKPGSGSMKDLLIGTATFTDAAGKSATVVGPNVFAGKTIFHVIDAVLMPATPKTQERGAAMPAKKAAVAAKTAAAGRHLLQEREDTQSLAIENQMNAATIAINNAAMSSNPSAASTAATRNAMGAAAVTVPSVGETDW